MVARISGVNLPDKKHICIALTAIYGIGRSTANKICKSVGVDPARKVQDLTEQEVNELREQTEQNHVIEGDLRRETSMNIKRKMDMVCYEGLRHRRGLPLKKRTKTNARTRKGKRKPIRN